MRRPPRLGMRVCRSLTQWAQDLGYLEAGSQELTPEGRRLLDDHPD